MNKKYFLIPFFLLFYFSCISVPIYNETAYKQLCELKVKSQILLHKATENYTLYKEDIDDLKYSMSVAYEYAKNRPNNDEQIQQFEIIMDPQKNLLYGVIEKWKKENTISNIILEHIIEQNADAFDSMLKLESVKEK